MRPSSRCKQPAIPTCLPSRRRTASPPRTSFGDENQEPDPQVARLAKQPVTDKFGRFQPDVAAAKASLLLSNMEGAFDDK